MAKQDRFSTPSIHHPSKQPTSRWLTTILITLVLLLAVGNAYQYFLVNPTQQYLSTDSDDETRILREQLLQLENQLATKEHSLQIDQKAQSQVRNNIAQMEGENSQLKETLRAYNAICFTKPKNKSLAVYKFSSSSEGSPHFRLTLVNNKKGSTTVSGKIELIVKDKKTGKLWPKAYEDQRHHESSTHSFQFKHVKTLAGNLIFPEAFEPASVTLKIYSKSNKKLVEQHFEWNEIYSSSNQ